MISMCFKENNASKKSYVLLILILYVAILSLMIVRHEPWSDETQAWLLARDASFSDLFIKYLRYEGAPGLWHLILMIPAKLHFPVEMLQIISGFFAIAGVYVFLRYSPFPKVIKVLVPFTYFIFYQYAVVARAYVVFPLLFFLLASIFHKRRKHPFIFFGLLMAIACLTIQGTFLAIGILLAHYIEVLREWKVLSPKERREQLITVACFILLMLVFAFVLWIPMDYYRNRYHGVFSPLNCLTKALITFTNALVTDFVDGVQRNLLFSIILFLPGLFTWYMTLRTMLYKRLAYYFIFPLSIMALLVNHILISPWNYGILFIYWLFMLWISIEDVAPVCIEKDQRVRKVLYPLVIIVLFVQCYWSYTALKFDWRYAYSGGKSVAHYIKSHHLENKKIYAMYTYQTAILAYFDKNILSNAPDSSRSFTLWTDKECSSSLSFKDIYNGQPDLLIIRSLGIRGNYKAKDFLNYHFVGIHNGALVWKDGIWHEETYLLFRKYRDLKKGEKISIKELTDTVHTLGIDYHRDRLIKNSGPVLGTI